jgi:hypothetical protein
LTGKNNAADINLARSQSTVFQDLEQLAKNAQSKKDVLKIIRGDLVNDTQSGSTSIDMSGSGSGSSSSGSAGKSTVDDLTSGGKKATNINIQFRNLIEHLTMQNSNVTQNIDEMTNQLIEGLLRVVNSANRIAD